MKTQLLEPSQLDIAAKLLKAGEIVAFPTETVFGLGVIYDQEKAFNSLVEVKNRPENKLFTLMVADKTDIERYVEITPLILKIIDQFMVGPLTIVVPAKKNLPTWVQGDKGEVGIRISSLKQVQELIRRVGKPLLVPSANISGEAPALDHQSVLKTFDTKIAAVIKGESKSHIPSTIIRINDKITLVREGVITLEAILKAVEE